MKTKLQETINIPEGITCEYKDGVLKCSLEGKELSKKISAPQLDIKIKDGTLILHCEKGNKNHYKKILSFKAHIKNMFRGLNDSFVYKLESANVHFPMTTKTDGEFLVINNFLGEKVPRKARILPEVTVEVKGNAITVSSSNRESAGQTAANIEKATKVGRRDRRIFQDGIYITEKPSRALKEEKND